MSHTNETLNYQLPQFVGSDKPAWLTDINGAFSDIDAAIYAAKSEADTNAGNISDLGTTVAGHTQTLSDQGDAITGLRTDVNGNTGSINSINSLIGSGHPTTSNQTIIGAINSTEASIAPSEDGDDLANSYSAGDQFMRGGTLYEALGALTAGTAFASLTLNTDYKAADTIVIQLGTLDAKKLDKNEGYILKGYPTIVVTGDGAKTYSQLLDELYSELASYIASIDSDYISEVAEIAVDGFGAFIPENLPVWNGASIVTSSITFLQLTSDVTNSDVYSRTLEIATSNSSFVQASLITNSLTDRSSSAPSSGSKITMKLRSFKIN